jgi:hypothetical protein
LSPLSPEGLRPNKIALRYLIIESLVLTSVPSKQVEIHVDDCSKNRSVPTVIRLQFNPHRTDSGEWTSRAIISGSSLARFLHYFEFDSPRSDSNVGAPSIPHLARASDTTAARNRAIALFRASKSKWLRALAALRFVDAVRLLRASEYSLSVDGLSTKPLDRKP